jgi:hypothetical protein
MNAYTSASHVTMGNLCAVLDNEEKSILLIHLQYDHRQEKGKARKSPQAAFAPIAKEEKGKSWSDHSRGLLTPPSPSTMTIDLPSQLTGVEVVAVTEVSVAQDSSAEFLLLLFVPP